MPVRSNDRHGDAGNPEVEVRHRRSVDHAQPNALAGLRQRGPVFIGGATVHQIGVCGSRDVRDVSRVHPHGVPSPPLGECRSEALLARLRSEIRNGWPLVVEVALELLEFIEHAVRVHEHPVRKDDDILPVVAEGLRLDRIDNQGAEMAELLLKTGMAVIPVGAVLASLIAVGERLAGFDSRETDSRHAVHIHRQEQAVPMDRCVLVGDVVAHDDFNILPFAHSDGRAGERAVDRDRLRGGPPGDMQQGSFDDQLQRGIRWRQDLRRCCASRRDRGAALSEPWQCDSAQRRRACQRKKTPARQLIQHTDRRLPAHGHHPVQLGRSSLRP